MSTSDRLGELRTKLLPHFIQKLSGNGGSSNTDLSKRAAQRFDQALTTARIFHAEHPEEDSDLHVAHLMQVFQDVGVPALESLPVINEFVLVDTNVHPAD